MPQQILDLQLQGLVTSPNNLSGTPPGAMAVADNVVINSKYKVDSRRGQTQYGTALTIGSGQVNKLFNYASSLITNYDDKLAYDSGSGVWIDYTGTFSDPAAGYRMRSLEALKNFYFTTDKGVYKLDELSATPRKAGVVRALGGSGSSTGSTGFLLDDTAVAYRMIWGYRDANNNLIIGAPSQRLVVTNNSGGDRDVSLTFAIPDSITTEYFYQIYRSLSVTPSTVEPADELQLVIEGNPTSGEISAKSFTVLDQTPYSLMGATLYTSPSQEGIEGSNYEPPFALDMDSFKGCAFYANIKQKQRLTISMISVEFPSLGYYVDGSVGTTNLSPTLTGIASTADLRVGMKIVGAGIPSTARILNIASPTSVTMTVNASATATVSVEFQDRFTIGSVDYWAGTTQTVATNTFKVDISGTPGQNINQTALNLLEIINTSSSNTTLYGYYVSALDDLPGQMLFEERAIGGAAFSATSTAGTSFSPELPTSGTTVISDNDARQNRVAISKPGQVEAVPIYTNIDIGSANFPIQRVVALRDGIFFFKQDGIFRVSGETFANFTNSLIDNTVTLKAPESAVPFNNQVFCYTTQGVCAVTDSGVQIMSVNIENTLLELSSEQFTNFATATFGVAYESARQYMLFTVTETTDTFATQAFVYNSLTSTWTRWEMSRTCGIVRTGTSDKLYMAQADTGQILIERKSYTNADFADEQYDLNIDVVNSTTNVSVDDATFVFAGMTLVQGSRQAYIEEVIGNDLTITETNGLAVGAATVYTPIDNLIEFQPIDCENPGVLKQFSEITMFFRNAAFRVIDATFSTNISTSPETVEVVNTSGAGWGSVGWGLFPWGSPLGGQAPLRTYVPRNKQRGSWLFISLRTNEAFTGFELQGISVIYNQMSSRFR